MQILALIICRRRVGLQAKTLPKLMVLANIIWIYICHDKITESDRKKNVLLDNNYKGPWT